MLLFIFLTVLALGATSPSGDGEVKLQRGNCPQFWFSFDGRCYKYVATHATWADAELYCVSQRANLVSIHSHAESNFVKGLIENYDHSEGPTWIGLSDLHKEGRWMWSDGSQVNFLFWSVGQPDNHNWNEHCVHTTGEASKWNDAICTTAHPYVCASQVNCS
ncbi:galactose-specific lectin nattectin-like [Sphaeramia orbicularis]|uniref:galactose-specific lectin nattectin-like n=1 Tax=Sphaeramia orbicularis TaxID=375764 RepID=UPI001180F7F5|nr:galactose-specific lectin nattectin-like [Sphaeramia orbicularis]